MILPPGLRLSRRACTRRDAVTLAFVRHNIGPSSCLPQVEHAFGFKNDEFDFARTVLDRHARYWLYRTHQQMRCGDFVLVDMSSPRIAQRRVIAVELKSGEALHTGIHAGGWQMQNLATVCAWLAYSEAIVHDMVQATRVSGNATSVHRWLDGTMRTD